ncbi:MAG: NADH-quinone oxidoreductase subunit F, partial [Desulfobacterales bacterium]|nr:NADH-quinone oxidoreductase subunit F [Deltaproteobacteria bacterium]NNL41428.1 NADH-quinone oxidoreductase subunit F [Desulfobacterales bacterium]
MNPGNNEKSNRLFGAICDEAQRRKVEFTENPVPKIHIGLATCGIASGALETKRAFEEAIGEQNIKAHIHTVGCIGHCYAEPVVIIDNEESGFPPIFYSEVNPGKAKMLVKFFLKEGDPRFEHVLGATKENEMIPSVMEYSRFNREKRVVMENCGHIDPEDIYDYVAEGGYAALEKTLKSNPVKIISEIQKSGLRGRGGAGFSTGQKWDLARTATGKDKIVICNADEGDPGAYMDRTILESNPHQVLEGMAICAYAVGAKKALVYVRYE